MGKVCPVERHVAQRQLERGWYTSIELWKMGGGMDPAPPHSTRDVVSGIWSNSLPVHLAMPPPKMWQKSNTLFHSQGRHFAFSAQGHLEGGCTPRPEVGAVRGVTQSETDLDVDDQTFQSGPRESQQ